jgi:SAM-dependent methyltransferase
MNEWSRFEDAQTRSLLRGAIPQKEMLRVLDLGSGTGHGYQLLSELGIAFNYSGLDISQDMCARLRWKYPSTVARCGNFDNRKHWPPGQFDFIMLLYGTFSFGQSPESTLRYIRKRLSDDGSAVISVCNRYSLRRLLRMQFASIEHYATRGAASTLRAVRIVRRGIR